MKRFTNFLVCAVLFGSSATLLCAGITNDHDWGGDFAAYIMQARSLAEGTSAAYVAESQITMEESSFRLAPTSYPWGFPAILAPLYALFGIHMLAFKSVNVVSYLLFLALLWFAWPSRHSEPWRIVFVALFAWNPYSQEMMNQVTSDVTFLLFSTCSIILICRIASDQGWLISKVWDHVLLGFAITAACFIRANGFLLLATLGLAMLTKTFLEALPEQGIRSINLAHMKSMLPERFHEQSLKRRVLGLSCLSLFLAVLGWLMLWSNEQYSSIITTHLKRLTVPLIIDRIHYYVLLPTEFFTGVPHKELIYGATIPLAIAGMLQRRASDYPMILYGVLTVLLYILVMPTTQGLRYILPLLPLYVHFVMAGIEESGAVTVTTKLVRVFPAFLVLGYFATTSIANATINQTGARSIHIGPYLPTSQQVFSYISERTERDSVIVFFKPRVMKLFADRRSILIRETTKLNRGDYLCLYLGREATDAQVSPDDIGQLLKEGQLSLVYQNKDFRVYRIGKSNPTAG